MASSRSPLLADHHRTSSIDDDIDHDNDNDNEETLLLGGFATTSRARPFFTTFHPTLFTRILALILALPSFIIFIIHGGRYAPSIVFLSFALARQLVVLGAHLGSQIVHIHIEVVHPKWQSVSARPYVHERLIKKGAAAVVDGGILMGLVISLAVVASTYPAREVTDATILGFIVFGLLLLSITDFGSPKSVTLAFAVEKPADGVLKVATSVEYGESDEADDEPASETRKYGRPGKKYLRTPPEDYV